MSKQEPIDKLLKPTKRKDHIVYQSDILDFSNNVVSTKKEKVSKSKVYDEFSRFFKTAFLLYLKQFGSITELSVFLAICLMADPETNRYCFAGNDSDDDVDFFCGIERDSRRKVVSKLIRKGFLRRVQNSVVEVNPNFSHRGDEQTRRHMIAYLWPGGGDHTKGMNPECAIQIDATKSINTKDGINNNKKRKTSIKPNHEF